MQSPAEIPFQKLIDALLDAETTLNPRYLYRLSDLDQSEVDALAAIWPQFPLWRRQALMEDVEELSESDTLLSFEALARPGCAAGLQGTCQLWNNNFEGNRPRDILDSPNK